ncbi:uncharacterized protein LOC142797423 [Rhipicephalus microplus]|uniref:uncharacterized protein LOC142797423 n=1 Tax=Rhipicephalus microplus TaxID=6941 RepID=UPI003F6AC27C
MSLTHAWLSLQLMPLIVDQTLSSLELLAFPDLPCLQAYDVTWNTQWDQPSGTTPEASRSGDIKPSPSPPDFSGGGSTLATMSLTHAWLSLQHAWKRTSNTHGVSCATSRKVVRCHLQASRKLLYEASQQAI